MERQQKVSFQNSDTAISFAVKQQTQKNGVNSVKQFQKNKIPNKFHSNVS